MYITEEWVICCYVGCVYEFGMTNHLHQYVTNYYIFFCTVTLLLHTVWLNHCQCQYLKINVYNYCNNWPSNCRSHQPIFSASATFSGCSSLAGNSISVYLFVRLVTSSLLVFVSSPWAAFVHIALQTHQPHVMHLLICFCS